MQPRRRDPSSQRPALVINGWTFLAWPAFDMRWTALLRSVTAERSAAPDQTPSSPEAKVLAALVRVIRDNIARDPDAKIFRLRKDLGAWRRVKFLGRLRLFYRFSSRHRIVVLTWLNDERTLRKEGSTTDPYVVFLRMLSRGEVPPDWEALVAGARAMTKPLP
ncbi:MAG TPA: type II toxin-antitoxin system YhaV family toxin [Gemmatimonadaceae bacterium]|nr:type II toxin-antitoxin system YhaV family toxin [Gemmatimonadaceae bacterium]